MLVPPDYSEVSYEECLDFDDNQFKKQQVNTHDQVIHALHAASTLDDSDQDPGLEGLEKEL